MAMKPYMKPRRLKRKPKTEIPSFNEWKRSWEFTHTNPIPMGNPYSHQPLHYAIKREMYRQSGRGTLREYLETQPFAMSSGDRMPDISRRLLAKTLGKGVARLHPIGMGITLAMDAKDIYNLLK